MVARKLWMDPTTWAPSHQGWSSNCQQIANQPVAGSSVATLVRGSSQPPGDRSFLPAPLTGEGNDSSLPELNISYRSTMQRFKEYSTHYLGSENPFYGQGCMTMTTQTWASLVLPYAHHPGAASLREQWNGMTSFPQTLITSANWALIINSIWYDTSCNYCGMGKRSLHRVLACIKCSINGRHYYY